MCRKKKKKSECNAKTDSGRYTIKLFLAKYSELINIVFGVVEGLLASLYVVSIGSFSWDGFKHSNLFLLTILVVVVCLHIIVVAGVTKNFLKKNKEEIIRSLLESCKDLLFTKCDRNKWSVCAMIQLREGDVRKTPYYVNADLNMAVQRPIRLNFGVVGKVFFQNASETVLKYKLSYDEYIENAKKDEYYKELVPEFLRAIFACAIFSKINRGKVIGVLEFDVLTTTNAKAMPDDLFLSIAEYNNMNALAKAAKAMAYLLEGI